MSELRLLVLAFCATKVTLIDVMPEPPKVQKHKPPRKTTQRKYQDRGTDEPVENSQEESAYIQSVSEIFDELLSKVDYVPSLAIKFCCKDGKTQTLARILESFPNIGADGSATREAEEVH